MLRTLDIILIVFMTMAAAATYTIKHRAEDKLDEVRRLEAEIRLEKDTIDLLRADWSLLTQPNRLQQLITAYQTELQLVPTESTQLAQPVELPMLKAELPVFDDADADQDGKVSPKEAKTFAANKTAAEADKMSTGSVVKN
jgi:hypothetical protein